MSYSDFCMVWLNDDLATVHKLNSISRSFHFQPLWSKNYLLKIPPKSYCKWQLTANALVATDVLFILYNCDSFYFRYHNNILAGRERFRTSDAFKFDIGTWKSVSPNSSWWTNRWRLRVKHSSYRPLMTSPQYQWRHSKLYDLSIHSVFGVITLYS